jgi:small multidrug resistance pump
MNLPISSGAALAVAILLEVTGTTALQMSEQLTKLVPTLVMVICYLGSLYFMSLALKTIPIGITYAIWSGLGIVLITAIGYTKFRQTLDTPALIGVGLIVAGVVIANLSKSVVH